MILKIEHAGVHIPMHRKAVKTIAICTRALNSNPRCPLLSALATHIGSWCIDFVSMGAVLHDHMAYYHLMMDIPSSVTFHALTDNIVYTVVQNVVGVDKFMLFSFCFTKIQKSNSFYSVFKYFTKSWIEILSNTCIFLYNFETTKLV